MPHARVIINKKSRNARSGVEERISDLLGQSQFTYDILYSKIIGTDSIRGKISDIESMVASGACDGITHLIVCGGDGTLGSVVNGVINSSMSPSEFLISVIPTGTANDFANGGLNLRNVDEALEVIKSFYLDNKLNIVDADVFDVRTNNFGRYGINSVDAGYGAYLIHFLSETRFGGGLKFLFGFLSYSLAVPLTYCCYNAPNLLINLNNEDKFITHGNFLANMQNSEIVGGGMKLCPGARIDDGSFDFVTAEQRFKFIPPIGMLFSVKRGRKIENGSVDYYSKIKEVKISGVKGTDFGRHINIDGELYVMPEPIKSITYSHSGHTIGFLSKPSEC